MYTIIDIETTGGNNKSGRITEIAAFLHNGHKPVDKFITLVNPGVRIPPFIKNLTGITDEMVADAPSFEEISAELSRFTANSVFVAHNAGFDYGFIKEEYRRLGVDFKRKTLCTVKLSRRSFPGLKSYSLGKLASQLDISLKDHHRAEADAFATVQIFEKIVHHHSQSGLFDSFFGVPDLSHVDSPHITRELLDSMSDEYGVSRYYNRNDELIYSKRCAELSTSICTKLRSTEAKDHKALLHETYRIEGIHTCSPLLAQLLEVCDVIEQNPKYNHGRFSMRASYGLFFEKNGEGDLAFLRKRKSGTQPKMVFSNYFEGLNYLKTKAERKGFDLLEETKPGRKQNPVYIRSASLPLEWVLPQESMVIIDEYISVSNRVAILIKKGIPLGYSIIDSDQAFDVFTEADLTHRFPDIPELAMVIRHYLNKGRFEQRIDLD